MNDIRGPSDEPVLTARELVVLRRAQEEGCAQMLLDRDSEEEVDVEGAQAEGAQEECHKATPTGGNALSNDTEIVVPERLGLDKIYIRRSSMESMRRGSIDSSLGLASLVEGIQLTHEDSVRDLDFSSYNIEENEEDEVVRGEQEATEGNDALSNNSESWTSDVSSNFADEDNEEGERTESIQEVTGRLSRRHKSDKLDELRCSLQLLRRSTVDSMESYKFEDSDEDEVGGQEGDGKGIQNLIQETTKGNDWVRSFYHLDPRWQILSFFNDLALEGADNLENTGGIICPTKKLQTPLLLRLFDRAGVFSVWRPTSNDAIRKMITGEGVGKGLDIKGKSALKGKYSGFVPFMQIHKNEDKAKVCAMTTDGRVRIFYPNQCSRDRAAILLKPLRGLMVQKSYDSLKVIQDAEDFSAPLNVINRKNLHTALVDKPKYTMSDPSIYKVEDYASTSDKGVFGLDIPEKLFWQGYVVRNDITREEGSDQDTGRPSMPEFQGMNFHTLRKKPKKNSESLSQEPRPVLYHAGCGSKLKPLENSNPLCPLGLLMAYQEDDGRVTPVVSDFDCFLVGTRGVKFHQSLGEQELSMLNLCVDEIEGILSTPQAGVGWTKRWLEVKKKQFNNEHSVQEMPKFGYADPKSYTMMTGAVHRLRENGAVRHGPECFNYGFPQELDDSFLIISDTLPGNVPWKYVNAAELKDILREKIDDGFTFPMNPKWILCDPGWKLLYDKLLASEETNTRESMGIWYPEDIRRRIHEISTMFPDGFTQTQCNAKTRRSSGVSVDLAEMELRRYQLRKKGIRKVRKSLLNHRNKNPTFFLISLNMLQIKKDAVLKSNDSMGLADTQQSLRSETLDTVEEMKQDCESTADGSTANSIIESTGDNGSSGQRREKKIRRTSWTAFRLKIIKPIRRKLSSSF